MLPFLLHARNGGTDRRVKSRLSEPTIYREVLLGQPVELLVDETVEIEAISDGMLNAIRLRTNTELADDLSLWETSDMNMPVIVPIRPRKVAGGDHVQLSLRYVMGSGYADLRLSARTTNEPHDR